LFSVETFGCALQKRPQRLGQVRANNTSVIEFWFDRASSQLGGAIGGELVRL
jgi:hypothetical protein